MQDGGLGSGSELPLSAVQKFVAMAQQKGIDSAKYLAKLPARYRNAVLPPAAAVAPAPNGAIIPAGANPSGQPQRQAGGDNGGARQQDGAVSGPDNAVRKAVKG